MSFTDLMIDGGFSDEQEYMDYLESEAMDYYDNDCCDYCDEGGYSDEY